MDGLGHALESLGIADFSAHSAVIVYFEVDSRCRCLLQARRVRPGAYLSDATDSEGLKGSVFALTDDDCSLLRAPLDACSTLKLVVIGGGSPCVGFSGANPGGLGINDAASNMLWTIPVLAAQARKTLASICLVVFFLENVVIVEARLPPIS